MNFRIPLWMRILIAVILAGVLVAAIFIGGKMILDIWDKSR